MQDAGNALDNFDDIATFKEPWQIQTPNFPLMPATCQYLYRLPTMALRSKPQQQRRVNELIENGGLSPVISFMAQGCIISTSK